MNLVRESILYEKFTQESDPIHNMGIGLYHDFKSDDEMYEWMADNLHIMLETEVIPDNIINDPGYYIRFDYYQKIKDFTKKYLTINGKKIDSLWPSTLRNILEERGFSTKYKY